MTELIYLISLHFLRVAMPPMALYAAWEHRPLAMVCCVASALIAALILWARKP